MRHASFWLTTLLALAASGTAVAQTDADAIYAQRLAILTGGGPMETLYQPRELVAGAPTTLPAAKPGQTSIKADALTAARSYAEASGAQAFIVWHDGKVQDETYFAGTKADTPLASKSLSKPMTAMVVGRTIELGKIKSLDQSVSDFITEWKGTPKEAMLIRHLLDMRTGFLEQGFNADPNLEPGLSVGRSRHLYREGLSPDRRAGHALWIFQRHIGTDSAGD